MTVVALTVAACASDEPSTRPSTPTTSSSAPTTTVPASTTTAPPTFDGSVAPVDATRLTASWRPGCPLGPEQLALLTVDHWGYDGVEHVGELVVHADHAAALLGVFQTLYDARFPIERMELVDVYGGDDYASTRANNTAGFNCRFAVGNPGSWSEHAFGQAIDVNPLVNPYVNDPRVGEPDQAPYLDRSLDAPGMIRTDDVVVAAFESIGWHWGGFWSAPDYQHFSVSGH